MELTVGQTLTVRQSIDFYPRPHYDDYVLIVDGPVTLTILDVVAAPSGSDTHWNVDIIVDDPIYGGLMTNMDIEPDDVV